MLFPRQGAFTVTAFLLFACAVCTGPAVAEPQTPAGNCESSAGVALLASPVAAWKGAPLRVVITADDKLDGELSLIAPDGNVAAKSGDRHGGPPYFWSAEVPSPAAGTWQAKLVRDGASAECRTITREITVRKSAPAAPRAPEGGVWPVRDSWTRGTENIYSAWIETLFDAPLSEAPSWPALHEVLRNRSRNLLFNHLGLKEDEKGLVIRPDCADLPYFLRAYFAFKMGLPFGYSKCSRGGGGKPPRCVAWQSIQNQEKPVARSEKKSNGGLLSDIFGENEPPPVKTAEPPQGLVPGFGYFLRNTIANTVHSGSGRTAASDNNTDYYPVPLSEASMRPGTVYADPYGHLLVVAKRVPQTDGSAGVLLAVDGQPDGTVARKRFWRGNFLFAQDAALGSPGFKRFRPVVRDKSGASRRMSNDEIAASQNYGDYSLAQSKLDIEAFYDAMDDVLSPAPLDPTRALQEAVTALEEQVNTRVTSVENGRKYHVGGGAEVAMPDGASIFETTGAWEDFATPSRDLRLLIAIDVVRGFPDRVLRRPERYAMPSGKSAADVKTELDAMLASELAARKFSYTRSDGSAWPLTLKELIERAAELEMAYNLNDCVERRWGAPETGDEAATCKRRTSASQRKKMAEYRAWFQERRRPPRG